MRKLSQNKELVELFTIKDYVEDSIYIAKAWETKTNINYYKLCGIDGRFNFVLLNYSDSVLTISRDSAKTLLEYVINDGNNNYYTTEIYEFETYVEYHKWMGEELNYE